jgi:4-amino-4-deoxy-L-arabinose transferase-like glycosyltransferase
VPSEAQPNDKGASFGRVETIDILVAIAVALALAVCHVLIAVRAELHPTEAYYWLWSRYPAISYYDHPPMVAWWIWAGTQIFGTTTLGIRIASILSVLATSAALYVTGRVLFGPAVAARAVLWFNVTLLAAVGGFVATPDAPSAFFWALGFLCLALVFRTGRGAWWLAVGLFAGLGAISKYTDLFLGLGILLALVIDRDLRRWFASPWLWAGGAVALVAFSPVLLWNDEHDWASFGFQFGRLADTGFTPSHLADYVGGQIALLNPFIAVFAVLAVVLWLREPSARWRREIGFSLATVTPLILYMLFHATHDRVDGGWLAPAYPAIALGAAAAAQSFEGSGAWRRPLRFIRRAAAPVGIAAALAVLGFLYGPGTQMAAQFGNASAFSGWSRLASDVDAMRRKAGANWIATDNYRTAAVLSFYLRDRNVAVAQVNERIRYVFEPLPDASLLKEPALLLLRGRLTAPTDYTRCFGDTEKIGTLGRSGRAGRLLEPIDGFRVDQPISHLFQAGCDGQP